MLASDIDAGARQHRLSEVRRKMDYAKRLMALEQEVITDSERVMQRVAHTGRSIQR